MNLSFTWLLCSVAFFTYTNALNPGQCQGGQGAILAGNFKGYKPISSYCASSYAVATVTNIKNFPAETVTPFVTVSTATVVNGTITVTGSAPTTTTTTTGIVGEKRDIVQDQVFNGLSPQELSSICACLRVTTTFTKSITLTYTKTVPTTATSYVAQTVYASPTPICLTYDTAAGLVNAFASLLTSYSDKTAEAVLAYDFTDTSDSINQLANSTIGSVTFPFKAAFEVGQGSQPPIGFTILSIDTITCTNVTFRWIADVAEDIYQIKGINSFVASNLNNTDQGWQLQTMYSEFNSYGWIQDYGAVCGYGTSTTSSSTTTTSTTSTTTTTAPSTPTNCINGRIVRPLGACVCQYIETCDVSCNPPTYSHIRLASLKACQKACDDDARCQALWYSGDAADSNGGVNKTTYTPYCISSTTGPAVQA